AEVLSELTNYTAVILGPNEMNATLKQIQIVRLSAQSAVAILVTNTGHVEHGLFNLPFGIEVTELDTMVRILDDRVICITIMALSYRLRLGAHTLMQQQLNHHELMYDDVSAVHQYDDTGILYVGGQSKLVTLSDLYVI